MSEENWTPFPMNVYLRDEQELAEFMRKYADGVCFACPVGEPWDASEDGDYYSEEAADIAESKARNAGVGDNADLIAAAEGYSELNGDEPIPGNEARCQIMNAFFAGHRFATRGVKGLDPVPTAEAFDGITGKPYGVAPSLPDGGPFGRSSEHG